MNQIIPTAFALAILAGCACPKQVSTCPPPKTCCYDAFRDPYRIAYPRLRPVAEQVPISNTQQALEMRRAAVLRQREGVRFENNLMSSTTPLKQPSTGTVMFGATEGSGVFETGKTPVPAAPSYPGPDATRVSPPAVSEHLSTPMATPVPGKPGYVYSPFSGNGAFVDVQGLAPGSLAKDPYSGRTFRVP